VLVVCAVTLYEVRCRGCMALLGVATTQKYTVYCDEFCASERAAVAEEERDAFIVSRYFNPAHKVASSTLGAEYGISRQRIHQIVHG
jgi:hypothetical protein